MAPCEDFRFSFRAAEPFPEFHRDRMAMTFSLETLGCLAYANGFSVWIYNCDDDPRSAVISPDYWNDAAATIAHGDLCIVGAKDGATILRLSVANGKVTASEMVRSA